MHFFLAVDGGGTHTRALVVSEDLLVKGWGHSGSADILNLTEQKVRENLEEAVKGALVSAGVDANAIVCACFGMPTYHDGIGTDQKIEFLVREVVPFEPIIVNDVSLALEAAIPMESGAVMLSGTGAMLMYKNSSREIKRIDGWGELAGDMGSSYYIGLKALQTAFKEFDGRIEDKILLEAILRDLKIADPREIIIKNHTDLRSVVANLSSIVCAQAEAGDENSKRLLEEAVNELMTTIKAVKSIADTSPIKLALSGGTFKCSYLKERVEEEISKDSDFELVEREFENVWGAVLIAVYKYFGAEFGLVFLEELRRFKK